MVAQTECHRISPVFLAERLPRKVFDYNYCRITTSNSHMLGRFGASS